MPRLSGRKGVGSKNPTLRFESEMPNLMSQIRLRVPAGSTIASHLNHDLIEHLPVGVYLCDQLGVLVAYNRKAAEIWGQNRMRPGITPCVIKPAATYAEAAARFHSPAASAGA